MGETITRPNVTTTTEVDQRRAWAIRTFLPNLRQTPNQPPPNRQPNSKGRQLPQLPQLPTLETPFRTALAQAKPTMDQATGTPPSTPALRDAKRDYNDQVAAMTTHADGGRYQQALDALPGVVGAARKVIALGGVAGVAAKQLRVQQQQHEEIKGVCDEVVRTYFNPNAASSSGRVRKEKLNPGRHFKAYLTALETVEATRGNLPKNGPIPPNDAETARQDCDALVAAAEDYLKHFAQDLSKREQADKTNRRKFQIVTEGLKAARQFSLAMQVQAIDAPTEQQPWDRKTEAKVGGLRAAINFETGYKKGGNLGDGGEAGLSESFWVESRPPGQTKATKNFIFKPMRGEQSDDRTEPKGSMAAKEALASANAKLFEQQTGIDLGIPETQVTTIGAHALDLKGDENDGQPRIGSLQSFAPSDGTLKGVGKDVLKQIPPKQCQKIAMHDIMALNYDRHEGNLLLNTPPGSNAPELVPIDHGSTLPSREYFKGNANRFGGLRRDPGGAVVIQNTMLTLPGAYEKFDPDTIAKLDLLDPEAMAQGMRDQLDALDEVNPGLDSKDKIKDESLQMSKRSMMFMKRAARELSPAEIQIAIGQHSEELFDADDMHFDGIAGRIIADMQGKRDAYMEIFTSGGGRQVDFFERLKANGWGSITTVSEMLMSDPKAALALYKSGAVNTAGNVTAKLVSDTLATLDDATVLRKSIELLIAQADVHLTDVDGGSAAGLLTLRREVAQLQQNGDLAGAETKARDLEEAALQLGLRAARVAGDELYAQRDVVFAGMGTDQEENAKAAKAKTEQAKLAVLRPLYRRATAENAYSNLTAVTETNPDLPEARTQLARLRRAIYPNA